MAPTIGTRGLSDPRIQRGAERHEPTEITGRPVGSRSPHPGSDRRGRYARLSTGTGRASGFAVLGVLYGHFWDDSSALGTLGVMLFFVLSGFLITDILLTLRHSDAALSTPLSRLTNFFIRRALRIWPAYYFVLGLAILVNLQNIRAVAGWHLLFGSNILFSLENAYIPWALAPWWSLSVEEQFYLFWPAVILLPRKAAIPWIVGALILSGVIFKYAMASTGHVGMASYFLPPAAFPALGTGSLLAYLRHRYGAIPQSIEWGGWLTMPMVILLTATGRTDWVWSLLSVLPMAAAVSRSIRGVPGGIGRLVRSPPLLWIGKRSYGIYLYHVLLMAVLAWTFPAVPPLRETGVTHFLIGLAASLVVAAVSWHCIERPANRLKRFFPYRRDPAS